MANDNLKAKIYLEKKGIIPMDSVSRLFPNAKEIQGRSMKSTLQKELPHIKEFFREFGYGNNDDHLFDADKLDIGQCDDAETFIFCKVRYNPSKAKELARNYYRNGIEFPDTDFFAYYKGGPNDPESEDEE